MKYKKNKIPRRKSRNSKKKRKEKARKNLQQILELGNTSKGKKGRNLEDVIDKIMNSTGTKRKQPAKSKSPLKKSKFTVVISSDSENGSEMEINDEESDEDLCGREMKIIKKKQLRTQRISCP